MCPPYGFQSAAHREACGVRQGDGAAGLARVAAPRQARPARGREEYTIARGISGYFQNQGVTVRWRTVSYRSIAAATDTFRLSTAPRLGSLTIQSHVWRVSWRSPAPSAPSTRTMPTFRSTS